MEHVIVKVHVVPTGQLHLMVRFSHEIIKTERANALSVLY